MAGIGTDMDGRIQGQQETRNFGQMVSDSINRMKRIVEGKVEFTGNSKDIPKDIDKILMDKIASLKEKALSVNFEYSRDYTDSKAQQCLLETEYESDSEDLSDEITKALNAVKKPFLPQKRINFTKESQNVGLDKKRLSNYNEIDRVKGNYSETVKGTMLRKWYNGTNFECSTCGELFWGRRDFGEHMDNVHQVSLLPTNHEEFASNFEEHVYQCKLCGKDLNHEQEVIGEHLNKVHLMSLQKYESVYENGNDEKKGKGLNQSTNVKGLPQEDKLTSLNGLSEAVEEIYGPGLIKSDQEDLDLEDTEELSSSEVEDELEGEDDNVSEEEREAELGVSEGKLEADGEKVKPNIGTNISLITGLGNVTKTSFIGNNVTKEDTEQLDEELSSAESEFDSDISEDYDQEELDPRE